MPSTHKTRSFGIGSRALLAGLIGLAATGAMAAETPSGTQDVVVSQHAGDVRIIEVRVSDLDLTRADGRDLLAIRINRAARQACDVLPGSVIDRLPPAQACVHEARAGALAQLEARGLAVPAQLALAETSR